MNKIYLLFGGNEGDRLMNMKMAKAFIKKYIGSILKSSHIYETEPWGFEHPNYFLNQVVLVESDKSAKEVLAEVLKIELIMGRERSGEKWKERTMDIDILFFNSDIIEDENLIIPHHYLHERKFALIPLVELEPNLIHPKYNKTITQLLEIVNDELDVKVYQ